MKSFEEMLGPASADWVSSGLIDESQRAAILQRHPMTEGGHSRFVAVLSTVGALLLVVGISLIVKANWKELSDWTKIGGLVALMVGAYAAGWKLKVVDGRYPKTGDAAFMVGAILFLLGIALVSQIFHLNARPSTGVLVWWLGIAAVPWITRSKGAQFVSIVAGLVWLGMEMCTPGSWIEVGGGRYSRDEVALLSSFLLLGIALWLSGVALRRTRWEEFAAMHEGWGLLVTGGSLYWMGFIRHFWRWDHSSDQQSVRMNAVALCAVLAVVAGVAVWRASSREMKTLAAWIAVVLVPAAGFIFVGPLGDGGWLWSATAWMSLFVLSLAMVRVGLETGREAWVNLGILFIAVNIVTRYFDLFGTMLEGGVFFIVTGVLVIALGIYLEKKRRALLGSLRKETRT